MPVVLQHEFLPRKGDKVGKWMRQEALPLVNRKSGTMHHIVINVDLLNGHIRERDAEAQGACPPHLWEHRQRGAVGHDHRALGREDESEHVPHVHHLFRSNFGEQEGQVLWHGVWLVGGGEEPVGLQAPVLAVLLHLEHFVLALGHPCGICIVVARQQVLQRRDLVIVGILFLELLQIFVGPVEDRGLGVPALLALQQRRLRRHDRKLKRSLEP
mmetsp:Transcript_43299/g.103189  ORF Transcript_43299/g.103189 Transcript_43299/m.103189 type:complete len:214 (+) Transcript_43299:28-669(+)